MVGRKLGKKGDKKSTHHLALAFINACVHYYPLTERIKNRGGDYNKTRQSYIDRQPLKRLGSPEEIAEGVLFLATNKFCTGVSLLVDGGMTM